MNQFGRLIGLFACVCVCMCVWPILELNHKLFITFKKKKKTFSSSFSSMKPLLKHTHTHTQTWTQNYYTIQWFVGQPSSIIADVSETQNSKSFCVFGVCMSLYVSLFLQYSCFLPRQCNAYTDKKKANNVNSNSLTRS